MLIIAEAVSKKNLIGDFLPSLSLSLSFSSLALGEERLPGHKQLYREIHVPKNVNVWPTVRELKPASKHVHERGAGPSAPVEPSDNGRHCQHLGQNLLRP